MQYNHVDRQLSRCAPSLHASPSMRKSSSPPYLPSLAPFPGPRFTFSPHSSPFLTLTSDPCPRLPPARAHVRPCSLRVPILVRALDLEPIRRFRRRRPPHTSPEHLLRRLLPRHAFNALHSQRSLCFRKPLATRHQLPVVPQLDPATPTAHPA